MNSMSHLRPITDASLAVIPPQRRMEAMAAMARAAGKPALRSVAGQPKTWIGDPDNDDLMLGLNARMGCTGSHSLAGIVRTRERYGLQISSFGTRGVAERAFLVDALTIAEPMRGWRPPMRTLLVASAVSIVATISHDPDYQTYVACRVAHGDDDAEEAVRALGGRPLIAPPGVNLSRLCFGDVPSDELRFLDGSAAQNAAGILLGHLSGNVIPTHNYPLPKERNCEALMRLAFSRPFEALLPEFAILASGEVDVGWKVPQVVSNDVGFPLRVANG